MISSESSSSYSDRGEWVDTKFHVSPYNDAPNWGENAEDAWGGVNVSNGQGILTRSFISGGFTWTGASFSNLVFSASRARYWSRPATRSMLLPFVF